MKNKETIYYSTENDEVTQFNEKKICINESYKYIHRNIFYKFFAWFTYRFIATPYAFIVFKIIKRVKFHNKKVLKPFKKGGYFIYANHTNQYSDGFCPGLICFPQKPHLIVNSANVSIPFVGKFTKMWGALPLPESISATKNFYHAIEEVLNNNNPIVIYPEAHLWPYYTKIRNFSASSFRYPVKLNKPSFAFTTTYHKTKNGKPKIEIYIDGPFYVDNTLIDKEAQQKLKDEIFETLKSRAKLSNYEFINYVQKEKTHD